MQIDALAIRLRPRTPMEASDLGVRLCREAAGPVYRCFLAVGVPLTFLALASSEISGWLPGVAIWCSKPWLDRTILFVLARAAFGQHTTPSDVWKAQRQVWWSQLAFTWTIRRLSPWRSLTQPVYQLEGLSIRRAGQRVRQIRRRQVWSGLLMTQAFYAAETAVTISVISLVFWFAPSGMAPDFERLFAGEATGLLSVAVPAAYGAAVLIIEPFYVGAGFAMYLNRRAELEAWDIEQEFRRAFAG